ncbi:MAG: hypothetical protein KW793_02590 [Candidatus Doudnabacteria bacterium]|nr:hypothetical protein [Candidatus Doudnabacteria bacterium]
MADRKILDYIGAQFAAGYSEQQIREALAAKSWPQKEINEAFVAWKTAPTLPDRKEIGTFMRDSWELYKQLIPRYFEVLKILLLKFLKYFAPGLAVIVLVFIFSRVGENAGAKFPDTDISGFIAALVFLGYAILFVYYSVWLSVSFIHIVRARQNLMSAQEAITMGKSQIKQYFWTSLLVGIFTVLWTFLLIVPGIIMGVYYSLSTYIVVDKNLSGMDAIRKSKEYLKGMWWQYVFSILGLGGALVAVYILDLMVQGALYLIIPDIAPYVYGVTSTVIKFLLVPFPIIYMYLLYERVKSLKPEIS